MTTATLSLAELHAIMNRVETETIRHDTEALEANPVLNAAGELYRRLKEAVELVIAEGQEAIERARDAVVSEWQRQRAALGNRAAELLTIFQEQYQRLLTEAMESIARSVPRQLSGNSPGLLDGISCKMALSVAPSVSFAATEWLKVVATGGLEVSVTYKFPTASLME
jgi:hypothetical protein